MAVTRATLVGVLDEALTLYGENEKPGAETLADAILAADLGPERVERVYHHEATEQDRIEMSRADAVWAARESVEESS